MNDSDHKTVVEALALTLDLPFCRRAYLANDLAIRRISSQSRCSQAVCEEASHQRQGSAGEVLNTHALLDRSG